HSKRGSVFYAYNHVCRSTFCREDHGCNLCCDRFDLVAVFPACQFDRFNGRWPRQSPRSNWWRDFCTFRANLLRCPAFRLRCDQRVSVSLHGHVARTTRGTRAADFLTTDGEKPDRHRDQEFEMDADATRAEVMRRWEEGWTCVFSAIETLKPEDVMRTVTIRDEPHTVLQALNRQVAHYAYHIGQIVFLAKHFRSSDWESLSIPRGKSEG